MSEDLESLGERIAEQAAHLDAAMHRLLTDLRAFDRGGGWHAQGARSCAQWLSWRVGWGPGAAREHVRVADRLAALPRLDEALRRGEISYAKLRAITRVATPANEAALLEIARHTSGHQLETVCRKYRAVMLHDADPDPDHDRQRRWVARRDTADGMVRIEAVLHPEEAALVWAALDHCAQQQCRESQRVSAESPSSAHAAAPTAAGAALDDRAHQQCREAQRVSAESPSSAHAAAGAAFDDRAHQQYPESQRVSAESPSSAHAAAPTAAGAALDHRAYQQCQEPQRVSAESPSSAPAAAPTAAGAAFDDRAHHQYPEPRRVSAESPSSAPAAAPTAAGAALDRRAYQQCQEPQRVSAESPSSAPAAAPTAAGAAIDHRAQQQCRESQRVSAESPSSAPAAAPTTAGAALDHRAYQQCQEPQRVSAEAGSAPTAAPGARARGAHPHPARSRAPFDRADALVQLAQSYFRGDRPERSPIELIVSVPVETLSRPLAGAPMMAAASRGSADAAMATAVAGPRDPCEVAGPRDPCEVACLADGTCVSAETARRMGCDCGVVEIVEGEHGVPLSAGRKRRTIPGSMKRALLQRDRTCRFPGCGNRLYLEAHHVVHWADGGETSLRNMVACCSFHHRFVHEYGYSIELHADGPHFLDRRGRRVLDAPPPPRPPDLGWDAIYARDAELSLTASVNQPLWDGERVDYGAVVDVLVDLEEAEARQDWP